MSTLAGMGTTYGLPNYYGELLQLTPTDTPLLALAGGIAGGRETA